MNIICTICAKSNSIGLKNKNLKKISGKPLINYTLDHAKKINIFNDLIISTDSKKIENICLKEGFFSIGMRPKHLSNSTVSKINVIRHAVHRYEKLTNKSADIIVDLDITSPLRNNSDILKSLEIFKKNNSNNLFSVCKSRKNPYFNMIEINKKKVSLVKSKNKRIYSRQKAPSVYEMNASIYIWKRSCLFSKNPLFNKKTNIYEMPFNRSIDIDDINDFNYVKFLMDKTK